MRWVEIGFPQSVLYSVANNTIEAIAGTAHNKNEINEQQVKGLENNLGVINKVNFSQQSTIGSQKQFMHLQQSLKHFEKQLQILFKHFPFNIFHN